MGVPRLPSEIQGPLGGHGVLIGTSFVRDRNGIDVTSNFLLGAQLALGLARQHRIRIAILKAKSPSCGSGLIGDGSFNGMLVKEDGVTTALLKSAGISVFNESQIDEAARLYEAYLDPSSD